jgi:hypothetical protein
MGLVFGERVLLNLCFLPRLLRRLDDHSMHSEVNPSKRQSMRIDLGESHQGHLGAIRTPTDTTEKQ